MAWGGRRFFDFRVNLDCLPILYSTTLYYYYYYYSKGRAYISRLLLSHWRLPVCPFVLPSRPAQGLEDCTAISSLGKKQSIDQSIDRPIDLSINPSIDRPINQ